MTECAVGSEPLPSPVFNISCALKCDEGEVL